MYASGSGSGGKKSGGWFGGFGGKSAKKSSEKSPAEIEAEKIANYHTSVQRANGNNPRFGKDEGVMDREEAKNWSKVSGRRRQETEEELVGAVAAGNREENDQRSLTDREQRGQFFRI